ncbi:MAG: phenylalanine--tRNA ligase subunit alpha [Ignavibacteria bacterium]|nr:phenylalanine--tRNA ligase subunit alpha [Ignavibacteria bacterium]
MIEEIKKVELELKEHLSNLRSKEDLENFRNTFLVKKGKIQQLFDRMRELPKEEKPLIGKLLNELRSFAENEFKELSEKIHHLQKKETKIDLTLPGRVDYIGHRHPIYQTMERMVQIFVDLGFNVAEGPDIEDEYHNFDALNFPPDHPARDMQDTFFIKSEKKLLLRTHTSPVQIRVMHSMKPPIRYIMPGRVYRNEAISARSLAEFHQIEGLYINYNVTFAELKGTMIEFSRRMFGENLRFRFRPSFFPFTEPSAELDISCFLCNGKGCRVCKHTGWLEIAGCGMVHPNVLKAGGIDPEEFTGYAFGLGIERVAMLLTGIDDIRKFYENDLRVLFQF